MDFEQALKELMKVRGGIFSFVELAQGSSWSWSFCGRDGRTLIHGRLGDGKAVVNQDDIDEILALVGWEYEISGRLGGWGYSAWTLIKGTSADSISSFSATTPAKLYNTKLLAAQAALIAVVERLSKGEVK